MIIYRYLFFFFKFPNPKQTIPDPGKSFGSNRFRIHKTENIYSGIVTFLSDELVDVLVVGVRQHDVWQSGLACISSQINNIKMFKSKVPNLPYMLKIVLIACAEKINIYFFLFIFLFKWQPEFKAFIVSHVSDLDPPEGRIGIKMARSE